MWGVVANLAQSADNNTRHKKRAMSESDTLTVQPCCHGYERKVNAPEQLNAAALKIAIGELGIAAHGPSRGELAQGEIAMLERAGIDLDEHPAQSDPIFDYAQEFATILATSLTPSAVARNLSVTPARIRRMIRKRSLYATRVAGRWHIPLFQFMDKALVPHISRVNRAMAEFDPVSVQRWITAPDPDLEGQTPLDWLKADRAVDTVLKVLPDW